MGSDFIKYSTLSVRVEEPVKESFNDLCERMGMNVSVAVNIFIRTMLREKKIPFEVKGYDPFYSDETQLRLDSAYKQLQANKGTEHKLIEDSAKEPSK